MAKQIDELQEEVDKRRTFAIISHPDAGKTTLTEKSLLFGAPFVWLDRLKLAKRASMQRVTGWRSRSGESRLPRLLCNLII